MKRLACRDAGMNCDFVAEGKDESEIMQKTKEHGVKVHGMQVGPELETKIRGLIKNV